MDTIVGVKGSKFSAGQKQRMAIARAILRDTRILILDEPTSALDTKNEEHIHKAIDSISKHITTIIIAHRLSTIRKAKNIIVLDKGVIVETGNHDTLFEKNGYYTNLIKNQSIQLKEMIIHNQNNDIENDKLQRDSFASSHSSNFIHNSLEKNKSNNLSCGDNLNKNDELEDNNENFQNNKKKIINLVFQEKRLVYLAIISSILFGICFPIEGLLIGFFIDMLAVNNSKYLIYNGILYTVWFIFFSIIISLCIYLQK